MNTCTNCGFENPEGAAFCGECGAALGQTKAPQDAGQPQCVQPEEIGGSGSDLGQQESSVGFRGEPAQTQEDDSLPQLPLPEPVSYERSKRSGAVGILLKAMGITILAGICFAAGGMARKMVPAAARTAALRIHHDSEPGAAAVCYDAEGYSDIGKVTVTGHQGKVLDTADQVKEGCYRWIASCQSLVYLDSQGDLYVKAVGGEAVRLAQQTDWSSLNPKISDDGRLLVYRDLSGEEERKTVYDLKAGEEMAVLEMGEHMPYYDADSGTLYYINSDSTLTAIDDSGEKQRVKGDISDFKVQDGVVFCNTVSGEKSYVIGAETEISLDGYNQSAFGVLNRDQYVVLLTDRQSGDQQLVMCVPGLEPAVLDRGPLSGWRSSFTDMNDAMEYMVYAEASSRIYYVKNGSLYYMVIPELDEKALSDQQRFEEAVDVIKEKLASGIREWDMPAMEKAGDIMEGEKVAALSFQCSPNGENLAWINSRNELEFYCQPLDGSDKAGEESPEPLTVDRNVRDFRVWDHSLVYVTDGWELKKLPLTSGVFPEDTQGAVLLYTMEGLAQSRTEAEGDQNTQADEGGSQGFLTKGSTYGDYVAMADPSDGLLQVFNSENEVITLEPHMDVHDRVDVWSSTVWDRKLTLEDIAGFYSCEYEASSYPGTYGEALVEINSQGQWDAICYVTLSGSPNVHELKGDLTWEEKDIHSLEWEPTMDLDLDLDSLYDQMEFEGLDPDEFDEAWETLMESLGLRASNVNPIILYQFEKLRSELEDSDLEPLRYHIELRDNGFVAVVLNREGPELNLTRATADQFAYARKMLEWKDRMEQGAEERRQYIQQEQERIREEKRRQEEERKRQEEQQKRQALITQARSYYNNGVYLSKGTRLYTATSLSSASSNKTAKNETWDVYDYQVDESSNRIWLKVKNSRNQYFWVYR